MSQSLGLRFRIASRTQPPASQALKPSVESFLQACKTALGIFGGVESALVFAGREVEGTAVFINSPFISIVGKVASILMFLKGAIRLKKGPSRFLRSSCPWVFSNELVKVDKSLPPGSWVSLEAHDGRALAYGYFNPHSLISFRAFERAPFQSEEQTRAVFFKRLDGAWTARQRAYGARIAAGEMGQRSFRLAFGESDGVPGFIVDLY